MSVLIPIHFIAYLLLPDWKASSGSMCVVEILWSTLLMEGPSRLLLFLFFKLISQAGSSCCRNAVETWSLLHFRLTVTTSITTSRWQLVSHVAYCICWLCCLLSDFWWNNDQSLEKDGGVFCFLWKLAWKPWGQKSNFVGWMAQHWIYSINTTEHF